MVPPSGLARTAGHIGFVGHGTRVEFRNIRIKPFATGQTRRASGRRTNKSDGGLDVKVGLGTNLVLDGTWQYDAFFGEGGAGGLGGGDGAAI